jgi:hypothetical protein
MLVAAARPIASIALVKSGQAVNRFHLGVQDRQPSRSRERVAPGDGQRGQEYGGADEADAGALLEVFGGERAMDPRADRASGDDDAQRAHPAITVPQGSPAIVGRAEIQLPRAICPSSSVVVGGIGVGRATRLT